MLAFILITIGIFMRFLPHTANFSPMIALALFGGCYLKKQHALIVPVVLMMISDLFLGMHSAITFTWGSVLLISMLGMRLREQKTPTRYLTHAMSSAVLFFVITNFGVWATGWYPQTFSGLLSCYTLAIPFFRSTLVSTLVFTTVFVLTYEALARKVQNTALANVLL